MRHVPLLALCLALVSIAQVGAAKDPGFYLADTVATQASDARIRAEVGELEQIYEDLAKVAGVDAILVWSNSPEINAFATHAGEERIVVVHEGLLERFGGDRDAVAAALGHELGHHKADHIREGIRKREGILVLGAIVGAVVGAKIGHDSGELAGAVANSAVNVGAGLMVLKFSRSQELEADRLAVGWMIATGYNPQGMLRLQQGLQALEGKQAGSAMLSTHPSSKKRYEKAGKQIARLAPQPDLLAKPMTPLTSAEDLAKAEQAIALAQQEQAAAEQERVADLLKSAHPEISAAALAPIEGVDFDTYAALSNQLTHAGTKGRREVLSRHGLDDAKMDRLGEGFVARMRQEPGMNQRYAVAYYRASEGRLAAWGRDLADSFEKDQDLKLEPPYSIDVAKSVLAQMSARGAPQLDETQIVAAEKEVLAPRGLSYYDFLIGHGWWSRKVKILALAGDASAMQDYFGAMSGAQPSADSAESESSGVHVGKNVEVGKGVYIGGKPVNAGSTADEDE